ncbi:hypothetical protein C8J57DRAFT_505401 [Mycena rebaudengoi]|nr:hypothetical protein C8J57DRAFT_505401 [Mycena rebaudengoi]
MDGSASRGHKIRGCTFLHRNLHIPRCHRCIFSAPSRCTWAPCFQLFPLRYVSARNWPNSFPHCEHRVGTGGSRIWPHVGRQQTRWDRRITLFVYTTGYFPLKTPSFGSTSTSFSILDIMLVVWLMQFSFVADSVFVRFLSSNLM